MSNIELSDFPKNNNKKFQNISTNVISGAIGGLIFLIALPILRHLGLLPDQVVQNSHSAITSVSVNSEITKAVEKAQKAVVGIEAVTNIRDFIPKSSEKAAQRLSKGSGIIYSRKNGKAVIVTNNHVIEGSSEKGNSEIHVILFDNAGTNKTVEATLIARDQISDIAVLEIPDTYVTQVADLGDSNLLKAGEPAIAIGNAMGEGQNVTAGIISSPHVQQFPAHDESIRIDAAINKGNSGGALLNAAGQVIGINTWKRISDPADIKKGAIVEGMGYAIPINFAKSIIEKLLKDKKVFHPWLGLVPAAHNLQNLSKKEREFIKAPSSIQDGMIIYKALPKSSYAQAGLQRFDIITAVDNKPIKDFFEFRKCLSDKKVGEKVSITFYHDGKKEQKNITLIELPSLPEQIT